MILKQAIQYNLAGSAGNTNEGTVHFTLQGDEDRIGQAVMAIRDGTKRSSDVNVSTSPAKVDPKLGNSPSSPGHPPAEISPIPMIWSFI